MNVLSVRESQCDTCIYREDSGFDIERLETQIRDPIAPDFFNGFRVCHKHHVEGEDPDDGDPHRVCRGFWVRHKDRFALGQVAQRLNAVQFTDEGQQP